MRHCRYNAPAQGYVGPKTSCTDTFGLVPEAANGIHYEWNNTGRTYRCKPSNCTVACAASFITIAAHSALSTGAFRCPECISCITAVRQCLCSSQLSCQKERLQDDSSME